MNKNYIYTILFLINILSFNLFTVSGGDGSQIPSGIVSEQDGETDIILAPNKIYTSKDE